MIHPSSELISHRCCKLRWATGSSRECRDSRSLGRWNHCTSVLYTACMRLPPKPQPNSSSYSLMPLLVPPGCYRLFPHQRWGVTRGSYELAQVHAHQQAKVREGEPSGRKQKLSKSVYGAAAIHKTWLVIKGGDRLWVEPVKSASLGQQLHSPLPWLNSAVHAPLCLLVT